MAVYRKFVFVVCRHSVFSVGRKYYERACKAVFLLRHFELYYIGGVACGDIVVHDIYPYVNNKRPKLSKIHRKLDGFFIYKSIIY